MTNKRALIRTGPDAPAPLEQLLETARGYAADSRASSTRKAYLTQIGPHSARIARIETRGLGVT